MSGTTGGGGSPKSRARHFGSRVVAYAIGIVLIGVSVVYGLSEQALERRYAVAVQPAGGLEIPVDPALVDRGRHLVTVVAQCTYCHGPDLAGRALADDPWIGRLSASNLTGGEGGIGARFTDADWAAALRRGVNPAGRSLLLMPSAHLARLSVKLQSMRNDVQALATEFDRITALPNGMEELLTIGWALRMNNLKVSASEAAQVIVHEALQIIGISAYKNDSKLSVGRHYRDALSASLMISNDRIFSKTASLLLVYKDD